VTQTSTTDAGTVESAIGQVAREVFAEAAQRLAEEFGSVTATALAAVSERTAVSAATSAQPATAHPGTHPSLYQQGHMRRRLNQLIETNKRYGHSFGLVVFDVDGPGTREDTDGDRQETMLAVVDAALRDSVRLVDEAFRLEEDGLCVLAPNLSTVEGVQMAERLLRMLDDLEAAGGLQIRITAGVVACPEHGDDAEGLLRKADEAMWRARAVGQPVGVGTLQDR
jgi:diguanylate cyclase (GGDEF)-like protein